MQKKVYAFVNKEKNDLLNSSSGGAFTAIYKILKEYYGKCIVYGAVLNEKLDVVHIRAEEEKQVFEMRGSKYVQSSIAGIKEKLKKDIELENPVLFTGTPCQISAMKMFCHKNKLNLDKVFFLDIICHGTASKEIWKKYINWLEIKYKNKVTNFYFRYKGTRWKTYSTKIIFSNKKELVNNYDGYIYNKLFLSSYFLNKGCFNCKFCTLNRNSDITIGDFWGIEKIIPDISSFNGVSQILVNSTKGEFIIENLRLKGLLKICNTEEYLKYQHNLSAPTKMPKNINIFWKELKILTFEEILIKYGKYSKFNRSIYLLKKFLGELGIINFIKKIKEKI